LDPEATNGSDKGPLDEPDRPDRPSDVLSELFMLMATFLVAMAVWLGFGELMVSKGFAEDSAASIFLLILGIATMVGLAIFMFAYTIVVYNRGWRPVCEPTAGHTFLVWDRWTRTSRYQVSRECYYNPSRHVFLLRPTLQIEADPIRGARITAELDRSFVRAGSMENGVLFPLYEAEDPDKSRVRCGVQISYQGRSSDDAIAPRGISLWHEIGHIARSIEDSRNEDLRFDAWAVQLTQILQESLKHAITSRTPNTPIASLHDSILVIETHNNSAYLHVCSQLLIEVTELRIHVPPPSSITDHPRILRGLLKHPASTQSTSSYNENDV